MPSSLFARTVSPEERERAELRRKMVEFEELGDEHNREGDRVSAESCYAQAQRIRDRLYSPARQRLEVANDILMIGYVLGRTGWKITKIVVPLAVQAAASRAKRSSGQVLNDLRKHASYLRLRS